MADAAFDLDHCCVHEGGQDPSSEEPCCDRCPGMICMECSNIPFGHKADIPRRKVNPHREPPKDGYYKCSECPTMIMRRRGVSGRQKKRCDACARRHNLQSMRRRREAKKAKDAHPPA